MTAINKKLLALQILNRLETFISDIENQRKNLIEFIKNI